MVLKKTYSIGKLAQEFDVTTRSVRFYEDQGLLNPALFIRTLNERFMSSGDRYRPTFMSCGC